MNVKIIKTGEIQQVKDGYGMRLIEQGKAVLAPENPKKPVKKPETEALPDGKPVMRTTAGVGAPKDTKGSDA